MTTPKGYVYSTDGSYYACDDEDEAVMSIVMDNPRIRVGTTVQVWQGELVPLRASRFSPDMVSHMRDSGCDEAPEEVAGDFPDASEEAEQELQQLVDKCINDWADRHDCHPNFGEVKNTKCLLFTITKIGEDLSDFDYKQVEGIL